nr:MMPL family transporter [Pseudofrankia saprophytica]
MTGRWARWGVVLLWLALALVATPLAARLDDAQTNDAAAFLPPNAESTKVLVAQRSLPGGDAIPAVVVFARAGGPLTAQDQTAVQTAAARLAPFGTTQLPPPVPSPDGRAALLIVPMEQLADANRFADQIDEMRSTVRGLAPPGLTTSVTGPAGVIVDTYTLFSDVEGTLLFVTAGVVAAILLIVYRGPFLWLVPLLAVGAADQTASAATYLLARHGGLTVNGQSAGILRVLVFGAGTDYALLLIARYREELSRYAAPADAMRVAVRRAGPAILASAGTVVISLLCLLLAELNSDRGLGPVGAIGIATAFVTIMTLLPAAMVICGRRLFWPFVPKFAAVPTEVVGGVPVAVAVAGTDTVDMAMTGTWARIGAAIARRPRLVWLVTAAVLAGLAVGIVTLDTGLRQQDAFRKSTDSIVGQRIVEKHFPPGASEPTYVVGAASVDDQLASVINATPGVAASTESSSDGEVTQFLVVLTDSPNSAASFATIERLRDRVHAVPGAHALVGGNTAVNLDVRDASVRDRQLIIPLVLAVVLVILAMLLRSVVAPPLLIATVVLSFLAALGVAALAFTHVFGFPGSDPSLELFGFIFLVALGVDYNIFLMTRVREEAARTDARTGVRRGLAVTGGVITSAGVVLAATFSVLFIFPLVQLAEIGFLVAFGVLLDTLVVRSILVPALALDIGAAMWWPSRLGRRPPTTTTSALPPITTSDNRTPRPTHHG